MDYSKLVAVTGLPGLYELVSSKNDGAIVRSLEDNSTKFASSRIHNFSHLESIEIYTVTDNVNLVEIFHAMEKDGGSIPDGKDNSVLKSYFAKVYPDMDFERVYASDLKKMAKWYEALKKNNVEIKLTEMPEEDEEEAEENAVNEESDKISGQDTENAKASSGKKSAASADQGSVSKSDIEKEESEAEEDEVKSPAKKKAAPKKKAAAAEKESTDDSGNETKAPAKKKTAAKKK